MNYVLREEIPPKNYFESIRKRSGNLNDQKRFWNKFIWPDLYFSFCEGNLIPQAARVTTGSYYHIYSKTLTGRYIIIHLIHQIFNSFIYFLFGYQASLRKNLTLNIFLCYLKNFFAFRKSKIYYCYSIVVTKNMQTKNRDLTIKVSAGNRMISIT